MKEEAVGGRGKEERESAGKGDWGRVGLRGEGGLP